MDASDLLEKYSNSRIRLSRLGYWRDPTEFYEVDSLQALNSAYQERRGVVWIHWDVNATGLDPGSPELRRIGDAAFLTRLLTDAFHVEDGDAISQIIEWRLNTVGTGAFGGMRNLADDDERRPVCLFDSEVFDVAYAFPNRIAVEMFRDSWRRALIQRHTVAGIATPFLAVTIRNDAAPIYFDDEIRTEEDADPDEDQILSPKWMWSDQALARAIGRWLGGSSSAMNSGDLLAAIARECIESYEEARSWLMAQAEEVEVARLAPDIRDSSADQKLLAARHHWLLQQASNVRAGLDWNHDGREVPEELFTEVQARAAADGRRRDLLSALTEVRGTLRSALDLVSTASAAEQLELSRQEAARSSSFQSAITFVATVLLAPGLVAAVFGAMPSVLEGDTTARFVLLAVLMVLAAALSGTVLRQISNAK